VCAQVKEPGSKRLEGEKGLRLTLLEKTTILLAIIILVIVREYRSRALIYATGTGRLVLPSVIGDGSNRDWL
jgi:hypothetical protein